MIHLWEALLCARMTQIPEQTVRFAYMELALPCLNQTWLEKAVEVNTYYRFYPIFKDMFPPEQAEFPALRDSLTSLALHMIAQNDIMKGMTKQDYYKKLLAAEVMVHGLVDDSIVYLSNECPDEILLYTGLKHEQKLEQRITFLADTFLDIRYHVEVFYEYHFGIMEIEETMQIDEISL